ncbi:hypothetical protein [Sinorhizobium fredii]|uniref:hypothetical protein n=1 Tax=Rhizobium fredii TaxID=380 RepID=UPI0018E99902
MKFASYWHETSKAFAGANRDTLSGDFEVAVVGAGFTGLNAARMALSGAGKRRFLPKRRYSGLQLNLLRNS